FFYARYPEPAGGDAMVAENRDMKVYYHRLGSSQDEDLLVYERPEQAEWGYGTQVSHDGRYLVLTVWRGTDTPVRINYIDLVDPMAPKVTGPVQELIDDFVAGYSFIANRGATFYFRTDEQAPRGLIV